LSHPFGAIRFATTPGASDLPLIAPPPHDVERMSINPNGNIGIDMPPSIWTGLDSALDQMQIGGGSVAPVGEPDPLPGLTMYGGNRFEGMLRPLGDTGSFSVDWRYIGFNYGINHSDNSSARFFRMARTGASNIEFEDRAGGLILLNGFPYDSALGMHDFTHGMTFQISGQQGLSLWFYQDSLNPYHHLFDVFTPGYLPYGVTRNTNGLSFFHTPLYIGSDSSANPGCDFQNLRVHPNIGDDTTWMLAVNGAALFKEAWVNSSDWPDYVFLPDFKLMSIKDFGNFLETNHHLPELPAAKTMNAGIPLGQTEEQLTKQVEEMARYIVELNKQLEALKAKVETLENGGK
jgi:hypothetical protein